MGKGRKRGSVPQVPEYMTAGGINPCTKTGAGEVCFSTNKWGATRGDCSSCSSCRAWTPSAWADHILGKGSSKCSSPTALSTALALRIDGRRRRSQKDAGAREHGGAAGAGAASGQVRHGPRPWFWGGQSSMPCLCAIAARRALATAARRAHFPSSPDVLRPLQAGPNTPPQSGLLIPLPARESGGGGEQVCS